MQLRMKLFNIKTLTKYIQQLINYSILFVDDIIIAVCI